MQPAEQAELWMQLRDRMANDWNTLSLQEKRACELTGAVSVNIGLIHDSVLDCIR